MLLVYFILAITKSTWTIKNESVERQINGTLSAPESHLPDVTFIQHLLNCPNCQRPEIQSRILHAARSLKKIINPGRKATPLKNGTSSFSLEYKLVMDLLERTEQMVIKECRHQFWWNRWTCDISSIPLLQPEERFEPTRERAFLQALTSAALTDVIIRQCAAGYYKACVCHHPHDRSRIRFNITHTSLHGFNWKPQECADYYKIGERSSRIFLKKFERGKGNQKVMNLRNSHVGRKVFEESLIRICKCMGPTGSCTWKTCWRTLPPFRTVGRRLKSKYNNAVKIDTRDMNKHTKKFIESDHLLYLKYSPNYCFRNDTLNIKGTLGRQCSKRQHRRGYEIVSTSEKESCRNICIFCGYRVSKKKVILNSECNCKFHWCCKVICDTCPVTEYWYHCVL